jgi:hypothetical protein
VGVRVVAAGGRSPSGVIQNPGVSTGIAGRDLHLVAKPRELSGYVFLWELPTIAFHRYTNRGRPPVEIRLVSIRSWSSSVSRI